MKKFLSILLAATCLAAMCACGSKEETATETSETTESSETTVVEETPAFCEEYGIPMSDIGIGSHFAAFTLDDDGYVTDYGDICYGDVTHTVTENRRESENDVFDYIYFTVETKFDTDYDDTNFDTMFGGKNYFEYSTMVIDYTTGNVVDDEFIPIENEKTDSVKFDVNGEEIYVGYTRTTTEAFEFTDNSDGSVTAHQTVTDTYVFEVTKDYDGLVYAGVDYRAFDLEEYDSGSLDFDTYMTAFGGVRIDGNGVG